MVVVQFGAEPGYGATIRRRFLDDLQQHFAIGKNVSQQLVVAYLCLNVHLLSIINYAFGEHGADRDLVTTGPRQ